MSTYILKLVKASISGIEELAKDDLAKVKFRL